LLKIIIINIINKTKIKQNNKTLYTKKKRIIKIIIIKKKLKNLSLLNIK